MTRRTTSPLLRDLFTGEGILEWVLGAGLALAAVLPHGLTWTQSGTFLTILAGMKGIRRGLVKIVAIQAQQGLGAPVDPHSISPVFGDADKVLAEIEAAATAAATVQGEPGTPEGELEHAGAPEDKPKAKPRKKAVLT